MEAESLDSLTPLIQAADQWSEVLLLLPLLVALEVVLSADNAIALAAISRRLHDRARQEMALNLGLLLALLFRIILIVAARWVLSFWPLELAASAYLLWLCGRHLQLLVQGGEEGLASPSEQGSEASPFTPGGGGDRRLITASLGGVVATLALTDLAFSLDSVAAAVAVSDRLGLIITGGLVGILALRLSSGLFIALLERYSRLESAGFLAVGLVGLQLSARVVNPGWDLPEWALLLLVGVLFLWGFSRQSEEAQEASS